MSEDCHDSNNKTPPASSEPVGDAQVLPPLGLVMRDDEHLHEFQTRQQKERERQLIASQVVLKEAIEAKDKAEKHVFGLQEELAECIDKNHQLAANVDKMEKLVDLACDRGEALEAALREYRYDRAHVSCRIFRKPEQDFRCKKCKASDSLLTPTAPVTAGKGE